MILIHCLFDAGGNPLIHLTADTPHMCVPTCMYIPPYHIITCMYTPFPPPLSLLYLRYAAETSPGAGMSTRTIFIRRGVNRNVGGKDLVKFCDVVMPDKVLRE